MTKKKLFFSLFFAVFLVLFLFLFFNSFAGQPLEGLVNSYGFAGLFFAALISNATILFPMPFDLLVFVLGASSQNLFFPFSVAIASGIGAAIGEMTSYLMGFIGSSALGKIRKSNYASIEKIKAKIGVYGALFVFFGSFTPFPFDLIGLAAGLIKYDLKKFFFATLAGKIFRFTIIGYSGMFSFSLIKSFFGF